MMLHTYIPAKYQLLTPYVFRDKPDKNLSHYNKVKSMSYHDIAYLQPLTMSLPSFNLLPLHFLRNSWDKILKVKVTTARLKIKSRSHHNSAHFRPLTNILTKYQLPIPYSFQEITQRRFYSSRSLH